MQRSGSLHRQRKAGALDDLATMLQSKAQMPAFSDMVIVIGLVALPVLIPAARLSRSQRRGRFRK
jgi:hypothetical protein